MLLDQRVDWLELGKVLLLRHTLNGQLEEIEEQVAESGRKCGLESQTVPLSLSLSYLLFLLLSSDLSLI